MVDGKSYPLGSEIPSGNSCRICQCTAEGMVCADEVCEEPEDGCVLQPPTDDECCNYKCEDEVQTVSVFSLEHGVDLRTLKIGRYESNRTQPNLLEKTFRKTEYSES